MLFAEGNCFEAAIVAGATNIEVGVRRVLLRGKKNEFILEWLNCVKGVVYSEDLPLSWSAKCRGRLR